MKKWKWMGLVLGGGMLLQVGTCATDFFYLLAQGLATQLASALVQQALGTSTTAAM